MLALLLACGAPLETSGSDTPGDTADTAADTGVVIDEGGAFLYTTGSILDFSVVLAEGAREALEAAPKEDVHATFTFEGQSWDVALHLKGSPNGSFRTLDEKAAFKIDFHEWDPEASFHGVRRLTLNSMVQDASMSSEHAAYKLLTDLAVPAPRHGYARLELDGEPYGLFGVVESMDEQFLDRAFPGDDGGNLWEGGYGGDLISGQEDNFTLQEGPAADFTDLITLVGEIDAAPDVLSVIEARFAADALFDMWATELTIADVDGYTTLGNNYLLYHAPTADRWWFIPWGPDQAFIDDLDVYTELHGRLAEDCRADAACSARLDEHILHVLEVWESSAFEAFVASETARIEADCREDPRSPWGDYGCRDAQAAMREWIGGRPEAVLGMVGG